MRSESSSDLVSTFWFPKPLNCSATPSSSFQWRLPVSHQQDGHQGQLVHLSHACHAEEYCKLNFSKAENKFSCFCFTQITPVQTNPQLVYPHLDWDLKLPRPDIQHPALGLETDGILLVLQHFVETHIGHQVDVVRVDKGQPLHNTQ